MKLIFAILAVFLVQASAQAVCLTIMENPQNLSEICRMQITNFFRYQRHWPAQSCNGIYSYRVSAGNVVRVKYAEPPCEGQIDLKIKAQGDYCFIEKALTPFQNTNGCH
jgi:hypothetical protein